MLHASSGTCNKKRDVCALHLQAQGLQDEGSMDPDDDLGSDDGKEDHMSNVFHSAHAHMHSIPHVQHQMGQPVPGTFSLLPLLISTPLFFFCSC